MACGNGYGDRRDHWPTNAVITSAAPNDGVLNSFDRGSPACRAIWGFTLDDFTDDDLSPEDHAWLDQLTKECAVEFAEEQGHDLKDYIHGGCVADWWGFTWMILAEARGVLTPEKRAAAWCRHGERTWWA
jgi:hypothetical protein